MKKNQKDILIEKINSIITYSKKKLSKEDIQKLTEVVEMLKHESTTDISLVKALKELFRFLIDGGD